MTDDDSPLRAVCSGLVHRRHPMIHFRQSLWLSIAKYLRLLCSKKETKRMLFHVTHDWHRHRHHHHLLIVHGAEQVITVQAHSLRL